MTREGSMPEQTTDSTEGPSHAMEADRSASGTSQMHGADIEGYPTCHVGEVHDLDMFGWWMDMLVRLWRSLESDQFEN